MARERISSVCPDVPAPAGPVRTCVGCRERAARSELLRTVLGTDAHGRPAVVPDPAGRAPGRGAHLHPRTECFDLAVRRRAFPRALRAGTGLATGPVEAYLATRDTPTGDDYWNWSSSS